MSYIKDTMELENELNSYGLGNSKDIMKVISAGVLKDKYARAASKEKAFYDLYNKSSTSPWEAIAKFAKAYVLKEEIEKENKRNDLEVASWLKQMTNAAQEEAAFFDKEDNWMAEREGVISDAVGSIEDKTPEETKKIFQPIVEDYNKTTGKQLQFLDVNCDSGNVFLNDNDTGQIVSWNYHDQYPKLNQRHLENRVNNAVNLTDMSRRDRILKRMNLLDQEQQNKIALQESQIANNNNLINTRNRQQELAENRYKREEDPNYLQKKQDISDTKEYTKIVIGNNEKINKLNQAIEFMDRAQNIADKAYNKFGNLYFGRGVGKKLARETIRHVNPELDKYMTDAEIAVKQAVQTVKEMFGSRMTEREFFFALQGTPQFFDNRESAKANWAIQKKFLLNTIKSLQSQNRQLSSNSRITSDSDPRERQINIYRGI